MAISEFKHVKISGISVVVPEKEINIYDEAQYYDNSVKKIDRMRKMVGFYKRRVVDDTTTAADLAYDAALNLINDMHIDKNSIDALVFVVQRPDVSAPASAYFIHNKLGLSENCIATDINQGCVGWLFGLYMASQMIQSGIHKKILLLNGDTQTDKIEQSNRYTAPLMGDGGCATLLEYCDSELKSTFNIETKSSGFEVICEQFKGFRFRLNLKKDEDFELLNKLRKEKIILPNGHQVGLLDDYMDNIAVFDFTMNTAPANIKKLMQYLNVTPNDIPFLCLHQANKQIVQTVGGEAGFDLEKIPYSAFENYGNNTMCSIPTTISLLPKEVNKENLLCCAFGNGLSCISAMLNFKDTYISPIRDFKKPSYVMTRDEYIDYWRRKIQGVKND